jgi:hypothetical protein
VGVKVSFSRKENDFLSDSYSDDPVDYQTRSSENKKQKPSGFLAFLLLLVGGTYFVQTTLAANINLNSGPIEFGQGITQTVACSGATNLTITPNATFTNASGGGAFYFSSLTVANVPIGCHGRNLTIRAFGNTSSTPLALFNSTSTDAVIYNNNGTFQAGADLSGATVSSGSETFTVTFTSPVALATTVFKITVESAMPTIVSYSIGEIGPGGGRIFYYDAAGFNCGPDFNSTGSPTGGKCNYLEVAPSGWNTGSDPSLAWATFNWSNEVPNVTKKNSDWNTAAGIGLGYKDSRAIVTYGNDATSAAGAARAYTGGSKNDWYLPSPVESNLLCQWARGVPSSISTTCTGGTLNSATYGASSAGFAGDFYWTSTQGDGYPSYASTFHFSLLNPTQGSRQKNTSNKVRPIRAF